MELPIYTDPQIANAIAELTKLASDQYDIHSRVLPPANGFPSGITQLAMVTKGTPFNDDPEQYVSLARASIPGFSEKMVIFFTDEVAIEYDQESIALAAHHLLDFFSQGTLPTPLQ